MNLRALLATRAAATVAVLLAGWPVLRWFFLRLDDGSDEPHGLVALAAALIFAPWAAWREPLSPRRHALLAALFGVYCVAFHFTPPLLRALLFVAIFAVAASPRRFGFAWGMLLALSLPLVATLQFYLGYPLRVVTAWLCTPLLALGGLDVSASGTTLTWAGERVIVDAPCGGIRMLWTGLVIAAALACHHRMDTQSALSLFRIATLVVFVANGRRATVLFCLETGLWPNPAWAHETVGLIAFAIAAALVLLASEHRARHAPAECKPSGLQRGTGVPPVNDQVARLPAS